MSKPTRRPARRSKTGADEKPLAGAGTEETSEQTPPAPAELRSLEGFVVTLGSNQPQAIETYFWTHVVRNRLRHNADQSWQKIAQQSREFLHGMGVDETALKFFADKGFVEVGLPYRGESEGWELRILPWERLLSLATQEWRASGQRLTVVRHLAIQPEGRPPAESAPSGNARGTPSPDEPPLELLFVDSAPGEITNHYEFEDELRLVMATTGFRPPQALRQRDPTRAILSGIVSTRQPRIIHLSGVDSHQAGILLGEPPGIQRADAFLLSDDSRKPDAVNAQALGKVVTGGHAHAPELVSVNCYYSGARLAPMIVAAGAKLAIGFQDTINDTVAEQFFAEFYCRWKGANEAEVRAGSTLRAFVQARLAMAATGPAAGDVILWSSQSLVPAGVQSLFTWLSEPAPAVIEEIRPEPPPPTPPVKGKTEKTEEAPTSRAATPPDGPPEGPRPEAPDPSPPPIRPPSAGDFPEESLAGRGDPVFVSVEVRKHLNYSLLHNDKNLFVKFNIGKNDVQLQPEVEVQVELYVGDAVFPFRATYRLIHPLTPLADRIRVPLVAELLRGRRESMHTSMFIEVRWEGRAVYRSTKRVTLLPADQWVDESEEWQWLPSFVLPRDPAVGVILAHAERHLRVLSDDSSRSFDGYTRLAEGADVDTVDLQVRAIWAALLYESTLHYVLPPPTYEEKEQRLRTPSMVLEGLRGTCIDLAVLFAACLEYIGLYPVIFLIKGHAFPGYWRRPADRMNFGDFRNVRMPAGANLQEGLGSGQEDRPWLVQNLAFPEIARAVSVGELVPIETVQLTQRDSFSHALELGLKNLASLWNFDAMVDIQAARDRKVTPLPLCSQTL